MSQRDFKAESESVLKCMNELLGLEKGFRSGTKRTKPLEARLAEHTLEEVNEIIVWVYHKWANWNDRNKYFNPTTLFRASNWERYREDFENDKALKTVKMPYNERKSDFSTKSYENYFETILGRSQFIREHFHEMSDESKSNIHQKARKSYDAGLPPHRAIPVPLILYERNICL